MKNKKNIGHLVSVKFTDRKTPICGYIVDYTDDWTLMKYNPVDFIIDGYVLFKNVKIKWIRRESEEKWKEKVINLKGLQPTKKDIIALVDIETILKYLTKKFGIFQLYKKSENACYLGRLKSIENNVILIDDLNVKGKWCGQMKFKTDDIRVIEFDTDYINSLKLISMNKNK